jgi:hypothetical protein
MDSDEVGEYNLKEMLPKLSNFKFTLIFLCLVQPVLAPAETVSSFRLSPTIERLAEVTGMTSYAHEILKSGHAKIVDKSTIRESCHKMNDLIILGCNANTQIFVFGISEPELNGIMENTLAHEMLHSGYARLSPSERTQIDALTESVRKTIKDKDILERLKQYGSAGEDVANELHSILGTEVANLPKDLEFHYTKYFKDRAKVVAFSKRYEAKMESRHQQVRSYDISLDQLKHEIDERDKKLAVQKDHLDDAKRRLKAFEPGHNVDEYNKAAAKFNKAAHEYNAGAKIANELSLKYKHLEKVRNDSAQESNKLAAAINGRS